MVLFALELSLVKMVKSQMVRMDVFVHQEHIGIVSGVLLQIVKADKFGMELNVYVRIIITLMVLSVCFVLMVKNGTRVKKNVSVLEDIYGMEIIVREGLIAQEIVSGIQLSDNAFVLIIIFGMD